MKWVYWCMVAFSAKRQLGNKGEDIACEYLQRKGFEIVERNYLKPWGEIDIIARKGDVLRFVEVKTISRATSTNMTAEDQLHPAKLKRLARTVDIYMGDRDASIDYQIDLVTVELNTQTRVARCKLYEQVL